MAEAVLSGPADAQPIHVIHVVRRGFAGGGMENGIVNVANRLSPERYRVSVCALDSLETFSQRIRRSNSEYYLLPKHGEGIDWGLVWRLARLLRRRKPHLLHSHNWATFLYAVLAAKIARVPVIHGEHGKNIGELDRESRQKYWAKSILGPRVNRLVTVSQVLAAEWAGYGVPPGKIQYIPNGVDTERFRPRTDAAECRRKFGLPENGILIGSVGRMDELKNYAVLITAFANMAPEFSGMHVALLGDGPEQQKLQARAQELGVAGRVFFLGRHPDPENFLAALDIFALPSKTEGMSNVLLEAMASGLPVVCADLPCHHEVFQPDREGVVVSPCTVLTLADRLAELSRKPVLRQALGAAAREKVLASFSIARMVSDYDRLYVDCWQAGAVGHSALQRIVTRA
jgi:sugar transferase (PEP-CTERM/EpsH1 system associated)